jgi:hypothetical protein
MREITYCCAETKFHISNSQIMSNFTSVINNPSIFEPNAQYPQNFVQTCHRTSPKHRMFQVPKILNNNVADGTY